MKYVKTFESFKNTKEESVNEEFLGALFNLVKGVFAKAKAAVNKTKGGKEVQAIYDKYLKIINDQLAKKAKVELNLKSEEDLLKSEKKPAKATESLLIKEADEAPVVDETETEEKDTKLDAATLKKKMNVITQIINLQKDAAKKEMQNILKKFGGAEKNPDLQILIDNKIREFDLQLLNAEIDYLERAGDKDAVKKLTVNRDKVTKELDAKYKKMGTGAAAEIKVGDKTLKLGGIYRYKTEDGVKTIQLKSESEEEGKVQAVFTYGDSKDKVQNFTAANIETDFKPEKGKTYGYFSDNNQKVINVEVTGDADDKGMVPVKTGKAEFSVEVGKLLDVVEKKG